MNKKRFDEDMHIDYDYINNLIKDAKNVSKEDIDKVLDKAEVKKGLTHKEIATLLEIEDKDQLKRLFKIAGKIKEDIYGNRVVLFAPLYISDYCVNNCLYCGYQHKNKFERRKLTLEEIKNEVMILEDMGHKRLALEAGEDPINCPIDYVLDAIGAIYDTYNKRGVIRRINVNIAATTTENYVKLKNAEIGTYILFQETYDIFQYNKMHPNCLKGDYNYHLTAFDRAMEAGIDDVGAGVLFGLSNYKFEVLALMMHNEHLERKFGVGFHTISVPRLRPAEGMKMDDFPYIVSDSEFKKLVAIIRLAVPFTGLILSTRESAIMRSELIKYGVSQVSAGSCTGVGGYEKSLKEEKIDQFEKLDQRSPKEVINDLIDNNYIPSYCTACYRVGRTGEHFMEIAKASKIHYMCNHNALITLMEYAIDYGDKDLIIKMEEYIKKTVKNFNNPKLEKQVFKNIELLKNGKRDLYI